MLAACCLSEPGSPVGLLPAALELARAEYAMLARDDGRGERGVG